ncbi:peptidase inhibitor family I36 protein [Micromonospora sp. WMMD882]|uniref:peptidase inhibitor family I36 protein n=1 Tax=Micromonospora sp. WMMD882 TaxID=3015151 RepID=UPI00248B2BEA|nr:peptidase inhibitor family I36 protein [Micromonospora sp. WMMD882]WBB77276.1 peptidase inhibitor family I36 protein [Micromonospora sp. WMMD882]
MASKSWRRTAAAAVGVVLAAGAGAVALAPAAQAAHADCPQESGYLCFWDGTNYAGTPGKLSGANTNWTAFPRSGCPSGTWNDCASSIWNEGLSCDAVVHSAANYGGDPWVIKRDTGAANLADWKRPSGGNWNNVISSNKWFCG